MSQILDDMRILLADLFSLIPDNESTSRKKQALENMIREQGNWETQRMENNGNITNKIGDIRRQIERLRLLGESRLEEAEEAITIGGGGGGGR